MRRRLLACSTAWMIGICCLALADEPTKTTTASTLLAEVHNARMLGRLKRWIQDFQATQGYPPASIQQLLLKTPDPEMGMAWLWLLEQGQPLDFTFEVSLGSDNWAIAARPQRPDSQLSLFISAEPGITLRGGEAGKRMGHSGLPPLDLLSIEKALDRHTSGPRDVDALLRGKQVLEAQTAFYMRRSQYTCSLEELDQAKAAGRRLAPFSLATDGNFDYTLEGKKEADGRCSAWTLKAKNRLDGFPGYEFNASGQIWVLPSYGAHAGERIPFEDWAPEP